MPNASLETTRRFAWSVHAGCGSRVTLATRRSPIITRPEGRGIRVVDEYDRQSKPRARLTQGGGVRLAFLGRFTVAGQPRPWLLAEAFGGPARRRPRVSHTCTSTIRRRSAPTDGPALVLTAAIERFAPPAPMGILRRWPLRSAFGTRTRRLASAERRSRPITLRMPRRRAEDRTSSGQTRSEGERSNPAKSIWPRCRRSGGRPRWSQRPIDRHEKGEQPQPIALGSRQCAAGFPGRRLPAGNGEVISIRIRTTAARRTGGAADRAIGERIQRPKVRAEYTTRTIGTTHIKSPRDRGRALKAWRMPRRPLPEPRRPG